MVPNLFQVISVSLILKLVVLTFGKTSIQTIQIIIMSLFFLKINKSPLINKMKLLKMMEMMTRLINQPRTLKRKMKHLIFLIQ